eukprot:Phypoly_transcript_04446.p2 GENE.Phypoly_transcript_04446~~Phypoly_transcript_04446.p2  ORF type:complete len:257 (-),score=85.96 Phypoly_transcript_04446:141-911(-)
MNPHTSDSEDEDDEDFVPNAHEEDEEVSDEEDGKRKLDDEEDEEDKPSKKKPRKTPKTQKTTQKTEIVTSVDTEKKVADIWEEMKKSSEPKKIPETTDLNNSTNTTTSSTTPFSSNTSTSPTTTPTPPKNQPNPTTLTQKIPGKPAAKPATTKPQTFTFAGEKVLVAKPAKGRSALDNLVSSMSKKSNKLSVMDKSKLDWDKYKTATGSNEELAHQKKNGYLEKVAFLQRTDERRFEIEKQQRQSVRESSFKQGLK